MTLFRQGYTANDPNNIDGSGNLVTCNYNVKMKELEFTFDSITILQKMKTLMVI